MNRLRFIALLLCLFFLLTLHGCSAPAPDVLELTVFDAGQGDCILLSQGGECMLIDTGSGLSRDALTGALYAQGVEEIDVLFLTHPHEDHYGNARMILETHTVKALFVPQVQDAEWGYTEMLRVAGALPTSVQTVRDGDSFSLGSAACEVLCALPDDPEGNNSSLILRVRFGTCVLLFMADAEREAEMALLSRGEALSCDFLKIGHHGSKTASDTLFLQATSPDVAVITCGKDNDYGFPHREVLEGLAAVGATVYRTDERGTMRFLCNGTDVQIQE